MSEIKTEPASLGWWIKGKAKNGNVLRIGHMWESRPGLGPLNLALFPEPGGFKPQFSGPYATEQELIQYVKGELAKWNR